MPGAHSAEAGLFEDMTYSIGRHLFSGRPVGKPTYILGYLLSISRGRARPITDWRVFCDNLGRCAPLAPRR